MWPALVCALAFAVRFAPLVRTGSLTGAIGTADGASFSLSAHLLHGELPYRDIPWTGPPGLAMLLLPFTALATVAGDVAGLAAARVAFAAAGALNAVLVMLVARRTAPRWAVAAGLLYATWRLPAAAERTVLPEPLLTLGLLGAMLLLGAGPPLTRSPRRLAASGAALGLAVAVTPWAGPAAALVAAFVLTTRGLRAAAIWLGAVAAAFAVVAGPFILFAPAAFARQVVAGPWQGSGEATLSGRLRRFSDVVRTGGYDVPETVDVMLATCVVVAVAALALTAWWQPRARLFVLLLGAQLALVTTASGYTYTRLAVAAPALVLVAAAAAHQLLPDPRTSRLWRPLAAVTAAAAAVLALTAVHNVVPRPPDPAALHAFASSHRCVWFATASDAIAAGALTPQLRRGCPVPVDRLGTLTLREAQSSADVQTRVRAELDAADGAALPADMDDAGLGAEAQDDVHEHFTQVGSYGDLQLWARRD